MGRKPQSVHWDGCPIEPSPEPGMVGKVIHGLNVVRNALPSEPPGSRSKSKLQDLKGKHPDDDAAQRVAPGLARIGNASGDRRGQ